VVEAEVVLRSKKFASAGELGSGRKKKKKDLKIHRWE
jgi:hypothetical protein